MPQRARSSFVTLLAAAAIATGCAPSLSTMQPAHVAPKGHVQAQAGFDVSVPTGVIRRVVDGAEPIADAAQSRDISDDEKHRAYEAGVNLATNPPSFAPYLGLAAGVADNVEVGARFAGGGWRVGGRYQILHKDTSGVDLTAGLGISRYTFAFPVGDILPILKIDDFVRWSFDVPIQVGVSGDFYRVWGGAKFMFSTFDTAIRLDVPFVKSTELASFDGTTFHVAGTGGVALGYKKAFLALELTVAPTFGSATTTVLGRSERASLGGVVVHPSVGLLFEF